jgi:Txe/YoeB family toxin of Txe-Axe toxin-antitoxin module
MPKLIPNRKFVSDLEKFKYQKPLRKKIAKAIKFLEEIPYHPGLKIERITNDPTAWSARIDKRYRISFEPIAFLTTGSHATKKRGQIYFFCFSICPPPNLISF